MPKTTDDFLEDPNYKEANSIKEKPVYIGKQEWKYKNGRPIMRDKKRNIAFTADDVLDNHKKDVDRLGIDSRYYGCIFYPEGTQGVPVGSATYEMNKAFIAGAIDANRECVIHRHHFN